MPLSIYQASVPPIVQILDSLSSLLDKAIAHCEARKIDPAVLIGYRLAPDMLALARQVQIATDQAKGIAARLAGIEIPSYPDTETSFEALKERLQRTKAFVTAIPEAAFEGGEDRAITLKAGGRDLHFTGTSYLFGFGFPNFYFHATTTYDILRHAGLEIGKRDFLGNVPVV